MISKPESLHAWGTMRKLVLWVLLSAGVIINLGTALLRLGMFFPTPKLVDFGAFYAGALAFRYGYSPYAWTPEMKTLAAAHGLNFALPSLNSIPAWPWLLQPLTFLSFPVAAWVWLALNLLLLTWCVWKLGGLAGVKGTAEYFLLFFLVLTFGSVFLTLTLGQTSIFLLALALLVGESLGTHDRVDGLVAEGALWVSAIATKAFPVFWLAGIFPVSGARRKIIAAVSGILVAFGLSWAVSPHIFRFYVFHYLPGRVGRFAAEGLLDDQSLVAWFVRLTQPVQFRVPGLSAFSGSVISWTPLVPVSETAVQAGTGAVLLVTGGAIFIRWIRSGRRNPGAFFYTVVLFSLLLFPHMERYNLVLLLPPLAWLWKVDGTRLVAATGYFFASMGRLTHLWVRVLPSPWGALSTGWGVLSAVLLMVALCLAGCRTVDFAMEEPAGG